MRVTACGETNERTAAVLHMAVAILYGVMLVWHGLSAWRHMERC